MSQRERTLVRVEGTVQGVGFRPFVYALAVRLGLAGLVGNDAGGVFAEVEGPSAAVGEFLTALRRDAPPLARIERVTTTGLPLDGAAGFSIAPSHAGGPRTAQVSADTAPCDDCLRELADPADRRFGYPFINCTNCGPRFTIVRDVPYDRPLTTMASFAMCAVCAAEYENPADRRFHAQPVCCPACGPRLRLLGPDGQELAGGELAGDVPAGADLASTEASHPLNVAAVLLRDGKVLAVKGLGGFHLAADATSEQATATLRDRKHREEKPFAVMVADLATAGALCVVDPASAELLTSSRRPIVLLPQRPGNPVASAVAPGNRQLGVMLPYTPLHYLLLARTGAPVVLTSGNSSDEPIVYRDGELVSRLEGIADAFLTHDRAIHIRTDDSVVRAFRGRATLIRRSRGYVPEPVRLPVPPRRPILACGAELKSTFCLAKDERAVLSQHIGDLENFETLTSFTEGIEHFRRLFDITPELIAHDLHPDYLSTQYATRLAEETGVELIGVQHHHAHIAACLADNGERGPVIGVAFDGTGYGTDGTLWGGEFLVAGLATFERAGHLAPVPLPGGAAAIRQPWRTAAAYLDAAYAGDTPAGLDVESRNERRWDNVVSMGRRRLNSPLTSSAGRLFDAAAAILGVRDLISYEGQAAIELEQLAAAPGRIPTTPISCNGVPYTPGITTGPGPFQVQGAGLIRAVTDDLVAGVSRDVIATRFHHGVAGAIVAAATLLRDTRGLGTVALSGGVFQNLLLLDAAVTGLEAAGFRVLTHAQVPCNDGGISYGQAAVAAAADNPAPA